MPADRRDRRAILADAAIDLLAEEGMRALTHRAVDTRAGLPQGTTSAYFRTRAALLAGIVKRLADRDREDLRALGLDLDSRDAQDGDASQPADRAARHPAIDTASAASATAPPAESLLTGPPSPDLLDAIAEATAGFIDTSLAGARNRTLARYHCRLESITSPDLRRLLAPHEDAAYRQTRDLLAALATPDVETRARAYVAAIDGLIFDRLVTGAPEKPGTPANRAVLTAAVRALLDGAVSRDRGPEPPIGVAE